MPTDGPANRPCPNCWTAPPSSKPYAVCFNRGQEVDFSEIWWKTSILKMHEQKHGVMSQGVIPINFCSAIIVMTMIMMLLLITVCD
jgi:endogenous inhibitor of DNA gyrase (YacG/DUF329 family)